MNGKNIIELEYIGYSNHDSESWYKCPKCEKTYGGWSLGPYKLKDDSGRNYFICRCGRRLYAPR